MKKKSITKRRIDSPEAIIITFPVQFLIDVGISTFRGLEDETLELFKDKDYILPGFTEVMRQLKQISEDPDNNIWWHSIGTKPTQHVLYAYITILGKIRYRATIASWEPGGEKQFNDGRKRTAKNWLMLSDLVPAPNDIVQKGFQGFRYSPIIF